MTEPTTSRGARGADRRWIALAVLAVTQFMVMLDQTVVTIATPVMGSSLGIAQADLSWITNAYVLTFGGFLMLSGRVVDMLGGRRTFVAGIVLFTAASLFGGFATDATMLLLARVVQGLGASLVAPAALASLVGLFPDQSERNRAMGIWAAAAGSGASFGVLLGGLLTDGPGWPWIFFINVPLGVLGVLAARAVLPGSEPAATRQSLDVAGAITVTGGVCLFIFGITRAEAEGWGSPVTLSTLALAVLLLVAFVLVERRVRQPLLALSLFRNRAVAVSNATMVLFAMGAFSMMFFLSLYMQQVLGYSPLIAGLAFMPQAIGIFLGPVGGWMMNRYGPRTTVAVGLGFFAVAMVWFAQGGADGTFLAHILVPSLLLAVGGQFTIVGLTVTAVSGVPDTAYGSASGVVSTSRELGGALGVGLLATLAVGWTESQPDSVGEVEALASGFQFGFYAGAVIMALGMVLVLVAMPRPVTAAPTEPRQEPTGVTPPVVPDTAGGAPR